MSKNKIPETRWFNGQTVYTDTGMALSPSEIALLEETKNQKNKNDSLKQSLIDIVEIVDILVLWLRAIIYLGTIAWAWFYLKDRTLAIAVTASLSFAHLTIFLREALQERLHKLKEL